MLSRLQQATTITLLLAAIAWAVVFVRRGEPGWAVAGALLILFAYALFLAVEFVLMRSANRRDPVPPATLAQVVIAWWGEVLMAPQVFCWRQPFRCHAEPDFLPPDARGRRGVVLVHGFVCNRGLWNPWMARLRRRGVPFIAVNLEPVFGSIDRYAELVDAAVRRVEAATGLPPVVVAHSMGGLVVRAWMAAHAADDRVHRVITIGAPHRGTLLARFGHTRNAREMRVGSAWQRRLGEREPAQRFARFTCFYGHCDNIVIPASAATLPGADNRHVAGVAHVHMAFRDEVFDEVMKWVAPDGGVQDSERLASERSPEF